MARTIFDQPSATVRQVSGKDGQGRFILSVLVKETYHVTPAGLCVRSDETTPLCEEPVAAPEDPYLLIEDTDLFPFKLATDLLVKGHAYNPAPSARRLFEAAVRVGSSEKRLLVVGDRTCGRSSTGRVLISTPQPVDRVPLSYAAAYGGRDAIAEAKHGNPFKQLEQYMLPNPPDLSGASPYCYARNLAGVGYVIEGTTEALESLRLPNLEDPLDPLAEDRLVVGSPDAWSTMPMPQATGWVDHGWFPRVAYAGMAPDADPGGRVPEIERGYAPAHILDDLENKAMPDAFYLRFANGASLGLQVPYLRGGEEIALRSMTASRRDVVIRLPENRPGISVDARKGQLRETDPVVHTVVVEPDEARVTIVWRGTAPALRPYMPDELARMPLRVELS